MGLFDWLRRQLKTEQRTLTPVTAASLVGLTDSTPASGKTVTEGNALTFIPYYAAVRVLAESVASLPLLVYERLETGKQRAPLHPAYWLLHDEPNPEMTAVVFKEILQGHLATWGNAYAYIQRDGAGRPRELWPLLPDRTTPIRKGGVKWFETQVDDKTTPLPAEDVLHIPGLGFDGITGYSVIEMVRQAIGTGMAADEFGAKFFANGAQLGGALQHPQTLSAEGHQRLVDSWNAKHQGSGNAWKPAILEEGMTWETIGIPPKDAQFLELRKFQATEIARFFRIPPHMLGDLDRATFSNIEEMSLEFVKYTLKIWLVKWEQECSRKLFSRADRGKYFCEFLIDDFLRADFKTRMEGYAIQVTNGWLTRNEVRAMENMNPLPGLDEPLVPLNMGNGGDEEPVDDDRTQIIDAHRRMIADAIGRILGKEADRAKRAAKKHADAAEFHAWALGYFQDERVKMIEGLCIPARAMAASLGLGDKEHVRSVVESHVDEYISASLAELAEAYQLGSFAALPCDERKATEADYLIRELMGIGNGQRD